MSEERYQEICKMSIAQAMTLPAAELLAFAARPMSDERRREIMMELNNRQATASPPKEGEQG